MFNVLKSLIKNISIIIFYVILKKEKNVLFINKFFWCVWFLLRLSFYNKVLIFFNVIKNNIKKFWIGGIIIKISCLFYLSWFNLIYVYG